METLNRREFLKATAATSGGLVIAFTIPMTFGRALGAEAQKAPVYPPNAFIRIAPDNSVTILINKLEFGQGVFTSLPMLVAEELECNWNDIRAEHAPVAPVYNHTLFGMQMTGGSTSIASSYDQLRTVGAKARWMLIAAAARDWDVAPDECRTEAGFVIHESSGKRASYGSLAEAANAEPLPETVKLKDPKDFTIIGKPTRRVDAPNKINGKEVFSLDFYLPGMLTAVVARPVMGGVFKSVDATKAKAVKGVVDVLEIPGAIAVVAHNFWAAKKGRDALVIQWDLTGAKVADTVKMRKEHHEKLKKPGPTAKVAGDVDKARKKSKHSIDVTFETPFLAHAPMEPLNCVVDYDGASCRIWAGSQFQTVDRNTAAGVLGLSPEKVDFTTLMAGGGFGRRANPRCDYIVEAAHIAKMLKKPVKVVWTREEDLAGGYYRPMFTHRVRAGLDANGMPDFWEHTAVGQSIAAGTAFESFAVKNGIDGLSVEGIVDMPYAFPNTKVMLHTTKSPVAVLWWRSVGHSHTAFVVESIIDELAHSVKKDPVEFRRALFKNHPRHLRTLNLAVAKSDWGKPLPKGQGRGIAIHESFQSVVAHVVEVAVQGKDVKVTRVTSAIDCGQVVNPLTVTAQVEGAMVYGLSAALYGQITLKEGVVQQKNFDTYGVLRMSEMPRCDVHIVETHDAPTGVGEPGTPPLAPALANAIFAATGKRPRRLPLLAKS